MNKTKLALCVLLLGWFLFTLCLNVQPLSLKKPIEPQDQIPIPLDYKPDDLVKLGQEWNYHTEDYPKCLRSAAVAALESMLKQAKEEGIHLRVFSAYRSSEKQESLYLNAIERHGPDQKWVAKPGFSEHQLGTAVDICSLDPASVANPDFGISKEGKWLSAHAGQFGFIQSYTEENAETTGYRPEPWHYRFRESAAQWSPTR